MKIPCYALCCKGWRSLSVDDGSL
ncbi:protein of unknown function [Cupriavidus taiwanensis]|nr:protein of unknown function [Cupriavidus taiwanensis]